MSYTIARTSDEVLTIRHTDVCAGWEQRYLLISDVHFDSPHCDRRLLTKHLRQAKEYGAGIIVVGDWFDAMGGKHDKRASKDTARPGDSVPHYFDALVDHSIDYLAPYADNLVMLSDGNHETAVLRHNETDLLARLTRDLHAQHMSYAGWIRILFHDKHGANRTQKRIYFHHGSGGGGPVTKNVIQTNRRAASVDADIYLYAHVHEAWLVENVVEKLNDRGHTYYSTQLHCQLATYKQEHGTGGYHIEKGRPPKPLGGWWLVFYFDGTQPGNVGMRFERAN